MNEFYRFFSVDLAWDLINDQRVIALEQGESRPAWNPDSPGPQTLIIIDIPPKLVYHKEVRDVAQLGSASGLGPESRTFKSCRPDHFKSKNPPKPAGSFYWHDFSFTVVPFTLFLVKFFHFTSEVFQDHPVFCL